MMQMLRTEKSDIELKTQCTARSPLPPQYVSQIAEALKAEPDRRVDVGQHQQFAAQLIRLNCPFIYYIGASHMGFGLPAAMALRRRTDGRRSFYRRRRFPDDHSGTWYPHKLQLRSKFSLWITVVSACSQWQSSFSTHYSIRCWTIIRIS
jgi:hypothetical protein